MDGVLLRCRRHLRRQNGLRDGRAADGDGPGVQGKQGQCHAGGQRPRGDPLSPHSVNRAIDRICAAYIEDETVLADQEGRDPVLIRHFSAHNLRHTFCTRFCENERNIKVIQEIMGHADIETTMNIYAEATKEKKKESFSNLEGKIKIS